MEGLIPYIYKAIVQHKEGDQGVAHQSWRLIHGSSSSSSSSPLSASSYMRLPSGDSGRFQAVSDINILPSTTTQVIISSEIRSANPCLTSRHVHHDRQVILMHWYCDYELWRVHDKGDAVFYVTHNSWKYIWKRQMLPYIHLYMLYIPLI